jgi:hypothetical protein
MVSVVKGVARRIELPMLIEREVQKGYWNFRLKHIPKTDMVEWKAWRVVPPVKENPRKPREPVPAKRRRH